MAQIQAPAAVQWLSRLDACNNLIGGCLNRFMVEAGNYFQQGSSRETLPTSIVAAGGESLETVLGPCVGHRVGDDRKVLSLFAGVAEWLASRAVGRRCAAAI